MAARKLLIHHQEDIRRKIQATQLVKVLQEHALTGEGEFPPSRMKAIEILLRKSVADLSSIELTGANGGPLQASLAVSFVDGAERQLPEET
jgi:hypothetical protein